MNFNEQIMREAVPDAVAQIFGVAPSAAHHPAAAGIAHSHGLREIVAAATRSDLGAEFATGATTAIFQLGYAPNNSFRRISRLIELPDFNTMKAANVDANIDAILDATGGEAQEGVDMLISDSVGPTMKLTRKSIVIGFTPELIKNDNSGAASEMVAKFGAACARRERRRVFSAFVNNPTLPDARNLYNETDGNSFASALNMGTLGAAVGMLARQKTVAGNELGAVPAFLVVNPETYVDALALVKQLTIDGAPAAIEVIAAPEIAVAAQPAWFLFADPVVAPVVAFNTLRGRDGRTIQGRAAASFRSSGAMFAVDHTFGVSILSRIGTVRGGVS